jgi:hypothetical protein
MRCMGLPQFRLRNFRLTGPLLSHRARPHLCFAVFAAVQPINIAT